MLDLGGGDGPFEFDIESAKVPNLKNKGFTLMESTIHKGGGMVSFPELIMDCCNTYID